MDKKILVTRSSIVSNLPIFAHKSTKKAAEAGGVERL